MKTKLKEGVSRLGKNVGVLEAFASPCQLRICLFRTKSSFQPKLTSTYRFLRISKLESVQDI